MQGMPVTDARQMQALQPQRPPSQQQPYPQQQLLQPGRSELQPQQQQVQMAQMRPMNGNQNNPIFDYNRISDLTSKYPRQPMPENQEQNMELGGVYQSFLYKLGECFGCCRTYIVCCCCVVYPYQQIEQSFVGLYERFGKYAKTVGSGLQYFNPCTDQINIIDMKTKIIDLSRQNAITKDNIEVSIDAAVYYHIREPRTAFYSVDNLPRSVTELTYATLRSVCGHYVLQDLLEKRDEVTLELGKFVARHVHEWGIEITNILIKDIVVNKELQDALSSAAKERRLAESKILTAKADVESAKLMRQTADILSSKAAMQIRYLETMKSIANSAGVKIVLIGEEETS